MFGFRRRKFGNGLVWPGLAGLAVVAGLNAILAMQASAQIQSVTPPVFSSVDGSGVDAITGNYNLSTAEVAIGQPGAGGLVHGRTWIQAGWRDSVSGTVKSTGTKYTVSLGASSETFTYSGGSYSSDQAIGSTLTFASNIYTYTAADGSVALFDKALNDSSGTVTNFWTANEGLITSLTRPDGEVITWNYSTASIGGYTARRPQSVSNNLDYMIHFTYADDSPANTTELNGVWLQRTKATGINRVTYACGLTAFTCSDSTGANWPYVSYAYGATETVTDRLGNVTKYVFASGKMTGVRRPTSPSSNSVTIAYVASGSHAGRAEYVIVSGSNFGWYSWSDASGVRTMSRANYEGGTTKTKSTIASGLVTEICADSSCTRKTTYTRDGYGRITRTTGPDGDYVNLTLDARGNVTQVTEVPKSGSGLSNITTYASYPGSCSNPKTCNQPTDTTDARGFKTDFTYSSTHGVLLTITAPAPSGSAPYGSGVRPKTTFTYGDDGTGIVRVASISACMTTSSCSGSADESVTTFNYGYNRLPTTVTSRSGNWSISAITTTTYTPQGDVATVDGPLSGSTDTAYAYYDDMRRLRASISPDPDGAASLQHRAVRTTYNADSQPTVVEVGYVSSPSSWASMSVLQKQTATYDDDGLVSSQLMEGRINTGVGFTKFSMIQIGRDDALRAECTAFRMNPATFSTSPGTSPCSVGTEGSYGPDRISNTTYNTYSQATVSKSGYGVAPRSDASRAVTNAGLTDWLTDANGNKTKYEYDGFNRLVKTMFPSPTSTGSWNTGDYTQQTYDSYGRLTSARGRDGNSFSFSYDNLGRMTFVDAPGSQPDITYTYDNLGRPTGESQSGHAVTRVFDALGRMTSETQAGRTVSYEYDAAGRRIKITWPDSNYVNYDRNWLGEVTSIRENNHGWGGGVLAIIEYDNLGRRVKVTRGNGSETTYAYDGASRLTDLDHNLGGSSNDLNTDLSYNPASELISRTLDNATYNFSLPAAYTDTYTPDGLNQYDAIPGATPSYDSRGNMTNDGTKSYGYDYSNRMTSAGSASLSYDPSGRLYQVSGGSTKRFLYDGADIIAEYDTSGNMLRRYVHGPGIDEPIVWYEGATTANRIHLFADERGSIVAVEGSSTSIYRYDEYGVPGASQSGLFQYTGQIWLADVGLYHYKARAYNPELGRFMQTDPIGYGDGMNMYNYVGGDPANARDPTGQFGNALCTGSIIPLRAGEACGDRPGPTGCYGDCQDYYGGGSEIGGGKTWLITAHIENADGSTTPLGVPHVEYDWWYSPGIYGGWGVGSHGIFEINDLKDRRAIHDHLNFTEGRETVEAAGCEWMPGGTSSSIGGGARYYDGLALCPEGNYGVETKTTSIGELPVVASQIYKDVLVLKNPGTYTVGAIPLHGVWYLGFSGPISPRWKSATLWALAASQGVRVTVRGGVGVLNR